MSLKLAAEHLKSQGRGNDTELVHMTKDEVRGLQTMAKAHGGSLTVNPETGLAEAGFLSGILPMIAGAAAVALAPETGGLSLLADPMVVGGGIGLADYAMTGSLKQGIMAGLGAYGGAGLMSGLGALGGAGEVTSESIANPANWGSEDTIGKAALTSQGQGALNGLSQLSNPGALSSFASSNMGNIAAAAAPMLTGAMNTPTMPGAQQQSNPFGLKTLSSDFKGTFPAQPNPPYKDIAQYPDYTKNPYQAGAQTQPQHMAVGGIAQAQSDQDKNFASGGMYPQSQIDHTQYSSSPQTPMSMQATMASYDPETNPLTGEPTTHMASGGIASYAGSTGSLVDAANTYNSYTKKGIADLPKSSGADAGIYTDTDPNTRNLDAYNAALYSLKKRTKQAGMSKNAVALPDVKPLGNIEEDAAGGLMAGHSSLGGYSDGGRLLKGPGDGMSDSIPAQIGKRQPARLADGEFVVPADVVSHLGNGSTEAGAKQLYAMMDKIRSARTGKKKQAPEVKPEKYLPK